MASDALVQSLEKIALDYVNRLVAWAEEEGEEELKSNLEAMGRNLEAWGGALGAQFKKAGRVLATCEHMCLRGSMF